jgi:hypothetical protein
LQYLSGNINQLKEFAMKSLCLGLILGVFLFAGCSTSSVYVDISYDRYTPRFQADKYPAYKDKKLFLSTFTNNAKNTSVFYYFSPDSKIKYGEYTIASYYWYCFEKAFNKIGMNIYKETASSDIAEFIFNFDYLSDQKISYSVTVKKRMNAVYQKKYEITMPTPESEDKQYLENRAYEMVDDIIVNILSDTNFAAAL